MTATLHAGLQLRAYQALALEAVAEAEQRGVRRQMIVAATGLGKTVIFTALAQQRGKRTLVLAHRDELITQAAAKVLEVWPEADVGVVKADRDEHQAQVVVASVQTLGRQARLDRMLGTYDTGQLLEWQRQDPFDLVIVDEAHHVAADSYQRILAGLRAGEDDGPLLVGVTATPQRGDGKGLDGTFHEVVFTRDMQWGIRQGFLSDLRGLRLSMDLDLSGVKIRRGDYDAGQTGALMEQAGAPDMIAQQWLTHAKGRRTLVFTPTVAVAEQIAGALQRLGVRAGWVSGDTPLDERRRILAAYSTGELEVLANCAVLTEGYDEPRTDCIVVARPTRSQALYVQMVGRGTRRHPDKVDCLVLDVVGASADHSLLTIPTLFGLDRQAIDRMERDGIGAGAAFADQMQAAAQTGRIRAEEANLWAMARREGLAWVQIHRDGELTKRYVLSLGGAKLYLFATGDDWDVVAQQDGQDRPLIRHVSMELAQGVAEDYVRKVAPPNTARLVDAKAAWRRGRPSPAQVAAAGKWRLDVDPKWTKGQLSDALTAHIERRTARKRA